MGKTIKTRSKYLQMIIEGKETIQESPPVFQEGVQRNDLLRTFNDYLTFEKSVTVPYIDAEDANFYPVFYTPNVKCFLIEARERHTTASTSGTVTVEQLANGIARG